MSYQEKRAIMSLLSSILIFTLYSMYSYHNTDISRITSDTDFSFWGRFILILIPVSIVARIVIHIVFVILNKIATNEDEPPITDEYDRLIELKSSRISMYVFSIGFALSMIPLVTDYPTYLTFMLLILSGLASDLLHNAAQIYYYRKGV